MSLCKFSMAAIAMFVLVVSSAIPSAFAQTYAPIYKFGSASGGPEDPTLGVIAQGRDGNLYSTTYRGGANGDGAVFSLTPAGELTTLHSFCSEANCADGAYPYGGLTLGTDGNFYGTAIGGGNQLSGCVDNEGCGTIFKISRTGKYTLLYSFSDGSDGAGPAAAPIEGNDGNFYGTTTYGGASQCGTIYKITPTGKFTSLYQFDDTHGCGPDGSLIQGTDGNFYGTAFVGGTSKTATTPGFGTIFKLTPAGELTVLYDFDGTHGAYSYSSMIQGTDGNFYGTTSLGGFGDCQGVIFKITPEGAMTELYCVDGAADGGYLPAGLVQASDGNFYSGAEWGGSNTCVGGNGLCGTWFQLTPEGNFSVLYNFEEATGYSPQITPVQNTNGAIYGITGYGGVTIDGPCNLGCGVFYAWLAHLPAFVSALPNSGAVGKIVGILGQGFNSTTTVSFNGVSATPTVLSPTYLTVKVPSGATTGYVKVTTSGDTLTSIKEFQVP